MVITILLRIILAAMSLIGFLLGAILAFLGIWLMYTRNLLRSVVNMVDTSKMPAAVDEKKGEVEAVLSKYDIISTLGIIVLIIGGFIAVVSICGGIGATFDVKLLLLVYIIITGILFIALLVCMIYFGTLRARMSSEVQKKLAELQEEYLISLVSMVKNRDSARAIVTGSLNFMHIMLKCCGVNAAGDARNSTSWLQSERRLMELSKEGTPFLSSDQHQLHQGDGAPYGKLAQTDDPLPSLGEASGKNIPDWLKALVPKTFTELPAGVKVPLKLPTGFKLPKEFEDKLGAIPDPTKIALEDLNKLFDDSLTIRTPITCCELSNIDDLVKGNYDVKKVYEGMTDKTCPFSVENVGVNKITCHEALMNYIARYQHFVVTVGTILTCILGTGVGAAVWTFFFG